MNLNSDISTPVPDHLPAEVARLDPASAAMGVHFAGHDGTALTYRQAISPWQRDRRGRPSPASFGVLIDDALGSAAYVASGDHTMNYVVSHLSLALMGDIPDTDDFSSTGQLQARDPRSGTLLATGWVESAAGTFALAHCRSVAVPPSPGSLPHSGPGAMPDITAPTFDRALRLDVTDLDAGTLHGTWRPTDWMINPFGTVQGGVLFGTAAAFTELTAESLLAPGQDHRITEFSLDLLGSPSIDTEYSITSNTVHNGRRLANIDVSVTDHNGRVLTQARSTVLKIPD